MSHDIGPTLEPKMGPIAFGESISILVSRPFPIGQRWLPTLRRGCDHAGMGGKDGKLFIA